jgi:methionyl-tRNA formyltransferase
MNNNISIKAVFFDKNSNKRNTPRRKNSNLNDLYNIGKKKVITIGFVIFILKKLLKKFRFTNKNLGDDIYSICKKHNIKIYEVEDINSTECENMLKILRPNLGCTIASRILKENILNTFKSGIINLHSSKLPEFRGISPFGFRETIYGFEYAYLYIFFIEKKLDTGNILVEKKIQLKECDYNEFIFEEVHLKLAKQAILEAIALAYKGYKGRKQKANTFKPVTMPTLYEKALFYKISKERRYASNYNLQ